MSHSALDRARHGDEDAFRELTDPHRRELHLHCYRMLGSLTDAEDLLQETLFAAWRGLDGFAERSSFRTWLYRIATNRCLNAIRAVKRRKPVEPIPPFNPPAPSHRAEVTWLQPYPDTWLEQAADRAPGPAARYLAGETVELAFVTAVQRLPPRQAAVLLLSDVLGFTGVEVAAMLDTTATAAKGALQRARASLDRSGTNDRTMHHHSVRDEELARRFAKAFTDDDVDAVIELLTDDAWLAMPPAPHEYHGAEAVAAFLRASADWRAGRRFRLVPARANGQPGFGCYLADREDRTGPAQPTGVVVLTVRGDRIRSLTRFLDPGLPQLFGLPDRLD